MSDYCLFISKSGVKFLSKVDRITKERIVRALTELEADPFADDTCAIKGTVCMRRKRVGKYRILYTIEEMSVCVDSIGSRGQIYKETS